MSKGEKLTLEQLREFVAGEAVAIRSSTRLQPAGGKGDKLFPPTYATGDNRLRYAMEKRRVDGQEVETVLLDSVQSQANRMEESLQEGWDRKELDFPVISIDFSQTKDVADLARITSLQAPHRIADALLRDSQSEDGTLFRDTEAGKAFTMADRRNATAVYRYCPTALVFGVWDSTGPRGGMGSKFQRALVSEIVGFGAVTGKKTSSRIDPASIQANVKVYQHKDNQDDWTIHPEEAAEEKGKPKVFSRTNTEGKGNPSAINHSNIAPSIDEYAGGVTIEYALHTIVLSLPALRRLRFQMDTTGKRLEGEQRDKSETAARTALAALAMAAAAYQRAYGYDLRSRCLLVPEAGQELEFEALPAQGGEPMTFSLDREGARKLLAEAQEAAAEAGFSWEREPMTLKPANKLAALISESRRLAAEHAAEEA
jgi:CRISPR-associated protein Csb1